MLSIATCALLADQVEMQNGDRYIGKILSLDTNTLVIQNEVLGTLRLPRGKASVITLDAGNETNTLRAVAVPKAAQATLTNPVVDLSASLRQLGANTNFIQQIQTQILAGAGPEANGKFNELVGGLLTGKLTVDDIRVQAKSAVSQLKDLKRGLGDDPSGELDGYLAILEGFLQETAPPSGGTSTNAAAAPAIKAVPRNNPGQ